MKKLLAGLLILASTSAFAATTVKSYDMYAPTRASFDFGAGLGLNLGSYEAGPVKTDTSGFGLGFELAYGIMDNLAVYGEQGYWAYENKTGPATSKQNGLTNTTVGVKGIYGFDNMFAYYDASYTTALLGKAKTDAAFAVRPVLSLTGGFGADIQAFGLGAMLGFDMYQDGDFDNGTTTVKYKSGSGMRYKVYGQYQPSWKVGLSYENVSIDSHDVGPINVAKSEGNIISVYGIIPINAESNILASLNKPSTTSPSGTTNSNYTLEAKYLLNF